MNPTHNHQPPEINKQKNSNLTVLLIVINLFLSVFFISTAATDQSEGNILFLVLAFIVLLGGYAFTYHGKNYRIGKWLFAIALIIGLVVFGMLWYATELGKAFVH